MGGVLVMLVVVSWVVFWWCGVCLLVGWLGGSGGWSTNSLTKNRQQRHQLKKKGDSGTANPNVKTAKWSKGGSAPHGPKDL